MKAEQKEKDSELVMVCAVCTCATHCIVLRIKEKLADEERKRQPQHAAAGSFFDIEALNDHEVRPLIDRDPAVREASSVSATQHTDGPRVGVGVEEQKDRPDNSATNVTTAPVLDDQKSVADSVILCAAADVITEPTSSQIKSVQKKDKDRTKCWFTTDITLHGFCMKEQSFEISAWVNVFWKWNENDVNFAKALNKKTTSANKIHYRNELEEEIVKVMDLRERDDDGRISFHLPIDARKMLR